MLMIYRCIARILKRRQRCVFVFITLIYLFIGNQVAIGKNTWMDIELKINSTAYALGRLLQSQWTPLDEGPPKLCDPQPWNVSSRFNLTGGHSNYFISIKNVTCFTVGTQINASIRASNCVCEQGWNGHHCSLPDQVLASNLPKTNHVVPRIGKAPRKIIHAFPFNNEFEMLEARFEEFYDVVDVFLILESNYTAHGDPKAVYLLDRLRQGYYSKYSCKIVHVFLGYFPPAARKNGWIADDMLRNYIANHGLVNQLGNFSNDDIFLMTDADELPYKSTVWFLKVHDGYPEPIGYHLSPSTFGFFWQGRKSLHVICAVSVGILTKVFHGSAIKIRSAPHHLKQLQRDLNVYLRTAGNNTRVGLWSFGNSRAVAGWHCSWCCQLPCIRQKLLSAQNGDFPRWGDYPSKTNITYIQDIVRNGTWFDNKSKLILRQNTTLNYAPQYLMDNFDKYKHILSNPYINK